MWTKLAVPLLLAFVPSDTGVLPLESLSGSIDVMSFGIAELTLEGKTAIRTFHIRTTYNNRGDTHGWTIDVSRARLVIGDAQMAPLLVNSDAVTLPLVRVARREHRVVDFYFELPATLGRDDEIDAVVMIHRVNTAHHRYEGRALLVRALTAVDPTLRPGWGSKWWAMPVYAWPMFYHRDGWLVPRPPTSVAITRMPQQMFVEVPEPSDPWPRTDECDQW